VALVEASLARGAVGPYQLQAAIAAVHDEAVRAEDTDWPQILALYGLLERMADNPMVRLNHAVALAMAQGPRVGLRQLAELEPTSVWPGITGWRRCGPISWRWPGTTAEAIAAYRAAAALTASLPEQRYLLGKAARLADE
jgi:predicted RNA polymerase sigma factor